MCFTKRYFSYCSYTAKVLNVADPSEIPSPEPEQEGEEKHEVLEYYKVQLIDENAEGMEDYVKVVPNYKLK